MNKAFRSGRIAKMADLPRVSGRRERNKAEKLERIKRAARATFLSHGYDEATTREIAARAKIGIGTLFLYAKDKRDLLFFVVNDDYIAVAERAAAALREDAPLIDNLLAMFRPLYDFFAADAKLSRFVLRESLFYETGAQAQRFALAHGRMVDLSIKAAAMAKRRAQIMTSAPAHIVGRVLFSVYQIEVRRWLIHEPLDVKGGIAELRKVLSVVINGLSPARPGRSSRKRGPGAGFPLARE